MRELGVLAESAGADAVFQLPSCVVDPAILTVWPNDVVVLELNVTATVETCVAHPLGTAVDVGLLDEVAALLDVGGVEPPEPTILISAHAK